MSTQPFSPFQTINTTQMIDAPRSTVWPVVRAMDEWASFQDVFEIHFKGSNGKVQVGQDIYVTANNFPLVGSTTTLERYNEIIEQERICWVVRGFVVLGLASPPLLPPSWVVRTARCIELFDDGSGGTIMHNWISYAGLIWPAICLFTGLIVQSLFQDFNSELAMQF